MEDKVRLKDLYISFFKIGILTFGGGLSMLPMLEKEIVDKHNWCTNDEILDYYAIGQCTPGIIAVNTATFVGEKHRGVVGGIVATLGIISPSLIIITLIAMFFKNFSSNQIVKTALKGIGAGIIAIIVPSIIKMAKKSLNSLWSILLAIASFVLVQFTNIPIYFIVVFAIIIGIIFNTKETK